MKNVSGLLLVLFIALKLTGQINWSWLWVMSPLWIGAAVSVIILLAVYVLDKKGKL